MFGISLATLLGASSLLIPLETPARAQEGAATPHWIWFNNGKPLAEAPAGTFYFRKEFSAKEVSKLALDATADNRFVLYLDGKEIARGDDWHTAKSVEARLSIAPHVLAAAVTNEAAGPAGFLLRGGVLPLGQNIPVHTNSSWKTTDRTPEGDAWLRSNFDDSHWSNARDLGPLGTTPWTGVVFETGDTANRFKVPDGFTITMVAEPKVTGSAISFNFDPQGRPCVGMERGPIVRLLDANNDGKYEDSKAISPGLTNSQGFSFIHGFLYAVGDGPQRAGVYRLKDGDGDGVFETIELVRASRGPMGEHGPHTLKLGPDGLLYFISGNHAHLRDPIDPRSAVNIGYEGELLPHYNDSRGHAAGILFPGGEIYRSADGGQTWERIVAGFRNAYDFDFNRDNELLSFDSDMEWDIGLPWYRPIRVTHCVPGADFGWRNGSADWPDYFYDSLRPTFEIGRGSPTGVAFYQARQFPPEYDDNFLLCDWSVGRILAVALTRDGATYKATAKELVTGQPLNCTDIEVGPDGAVYFTTGGRGTLGGLFRVAANRPPQPKLGDSIQDALAIDSPLSAFSQEALRKIKEKEGDRWGKMLADIARGTDPSAKSRDRVRALDLLTQLGPQPGDDLLKVLAQDPDARVRAQTVLLLGMRDSATAIAAVSRALFDKDSFVRRRACEALVRSRAPVPTENVLPLLAEPDPWIRFSARNAIEHGDAMTYRDAIMSYKEPRRLLEGMLVLARATKLDEPAQTEMLNRQVALLRESLAPDERLDLLRLIGVTYMQGPLKPAQSPASAQIAPLLLEALPGPEGPLRLESARLLAYLAGPYSPKAVAAILKLQADDPDHANQIHYTYCLRVLKDGWTTGEKRQLWAWYETASHWDGGYSYLGYLDFMLRELVAILTPAEQRTLLSQGEKFPFPTRIMVRSIDLNTVSEGIAELSGLYSRLNQTDNPNAASELRATILNAFGQSQNPQTHEVLRSLYTNDQARRNLIVRALSSHPTADDLPTLISALETRDPNTAGILVAALKRLDSVPKGPEGLRNLIGLARRTGPAMLADLNTLGRKWLSDVTAPQLDFAKTLQFWETTYAQRFPKGPALAGSASAESPNSYTLDQLRQALTNPDLISKASPERGRAAIVKARCLDCHKLGDQGQGLGPDLTTVSSRFRPSEIMESIAEPSKVISDQYKSLQVATTDGKVLVGMPTAGEPDKLVLLLSDGTKLTIPKSEIDEQKESNISVMPEGLVNALSLQEIVDMLALFDSMPRVEAPPTEPTKKQ
jgi:putative heme-binding domain-containing protein